MTDKQLASDDDAANEIAIALLAAAHTAVKDYYGVDHTSVSGADRMAVLAIALGISIAATTTEEIPHDQMFDLAGRPRGVLSRLYLHRSRTPLRQVDLAAPDEGQEHLIGVAAGECEGMCGV